MKLIAAVDANWAIGSKGQLLTSIPEDMKFFRAKTTGHVVVMGRKTLESFPNGKPLPNRTNIVLTHNKNYDAKGAIVVTSEEELYAELEKYDSDDIFVIGGDSIYHKLLDKCDEAFITKIDFEFDADAYFPNLDTNPEWEMSEQGEEETYFDLIYEFDTYRKK